MNLFLYMDIILFALLAIVVGFFLWRVLGTRVGFEVSAGAGTGVDSSSIELKGAALVLNQLKTSMPHFSQREFLRKAVKAYCMIVEAFHKQDKKTLKENLTPEAYEKFVSGMKGKANAKTSSAASKAKSKTAQAKLPEFTVKSAQISDKGSEIKSGSIRLSVEFLVALNKEKIKERWTFERPESVESPMWWLAQTHSSVKKEAASRSGSKRVVN